MDNKELLSSLLNERIKLAERLEGISFYLDKSSGKEKDLALDQYQHMQNYLEALTQRIKYYEQ